MFLNKKKRRSRTFGESMRGPQLMHPGVELCEPGVVEAMKSCMGQATYLLAMDS